MDSLGKFKFTVSLQPQLSSPKGSQNQTGNTFLFGY